MKIVSYAGQSFTTADEVADALLTLAAELATAERADTVEIPVIDDEGLASTARFVVGPASQLVSRPVRSPFAEPSASSVVAELTQRAEMLAHPKAPVMAHADGLMLDFD